MTDHATITSLRLKNFKAFSLFTLSLKDVNILAGPNNSGKSTILGACRVLASGIRHARVRNPTYIEMPDGARFGYHISADAIPISLENVHTDYADVVSTVEFRVSNGNALLLVFTADRECILVPESERGVRRPSDFIREFPLTIGVVPVLGPVEHEEPIVEETTVRRELQTHRASRHFRNYWHYFPDNFQDFADLVAKTWPGIVLRPPKKPEMMSKHLVMFCEENRIPRELYWAGFGYQIWCQLLTHLQRAQNDSLVLIDEPEIYLHPDVQRQLLGILRDLGPDVLLATHSTEIMTEADPSEIIIIDKTRRAGKRLQTTQGAQEALDLVGSAQNITLTRLARNRRVLFVEGGRDFDIIRRIARRLGLQELSAAVDITPVESGGFTTWERLAALAWGIEKTLGQSMVIGAVFDRDYWCAEQIKQITNTLSQHLRFVHFHWWKEIENYLLIPEVIDDTIQLCVEDRIRRGGKVEQDIEPACDILRRITDPQRAFLEGQYIAKRTEFLRPTGKDAGTLAMETIANFASKWDDIHSRVGMVHGKDTLAALRSEAQCRWKINLTDARIIQCLTPEYMPEDLKALMAGLDNFRHTS